MTGRGSVVDAVIGLVVLLFSVVLHENAHGLVASWLGDDTAKKSGRLTLNPAKHLDPVGSVIMPLFLFFANLPMFGYAKPVPVNPRNLRGTDRTGFAIVAAAGPISNVIIALVAAIVAKVRYGIPGDLLSKVVVLGSSRLGFMVYILSAIVAWNIVLAAFNLLPIPPLDGSRFLRLFLSPQGRQKLDRIEPVGFLILFGLLFFLQEPVFRVVGIIESGLLRLLPG